MERKRRRRKEGGGGEEEEGKEEEEEEAVSVWRINPADKQTGPDRTGPERKTTNVDRATLRNITSFIAVVLKFAVFQAEFCSAPDSCS